MAPRPHTILRVLAVLTALTAGVLAISGPASRAAARPSGQAPSSNGVAEAVAVLTRPEFGPAGHTVRFAGPVLTVRLEIGPDPRLRAHVQAALRFVGRATKLRIEVVDGPAQLVVRERPGSGGRARVFDRDGVIERAEVEISCCRQRVAFEEIAQAAGALGDRAVAGSVFSQDQSARRPSRFDYQVLSVLYALPPGSDAAQVRLEAERRISG